MKVVGILSMVRNSVGENSYVADEIIQSRAGLRIRIGNTDGEGRMIMTDPLCFVSTIYRFSHQFVDMLIRSFFRPKNKL